MERSGLAMGGLGLVVVALLGWQSWTMAGLQGRVAVLEQVAATNLGGPGVAMDGAQSQEVVARAVKAVQAAQTEAAGKGLTEEQTQALVEEALAATLEDTLEDTLDAREARQKDERTEQWLAMATESMQLELEDLAQDHGIDEETQDTVLTLLVDATREGVEIRRALGDGDISVREAKAEGEALENDLAVELDELLGRDVNDELAEKIRPGNPWKRADG